MLNKWKVIPLGIIFITGLIISNSDFNNIKYLFIIPLIVISVILVSREVKDKRIYFLIIITLIIGLLRGGFLSSRYLEAISNIGSYMGNIEVIEVKDKYYIGKIEDGFKIIFYFEEEKLMIGDFIRVDDGYLRLPKDEMNEGGFSFRRYLKNKGIYLELGINKSSLIGGKRNLGYYLHRYKDSYLNKMKRYLGENIKYVESIFLGKTNSLEKEENNLWRKLGISHLQAVSGAQVGVLIDLIMLIYVISPGKNPFKTTLFILVIVFYGYLTNTPSVWRTIFFYFISLFVIKGNIESDDLSKITLSGIILLFINPNYIFDISFQLSFGVSFGVTLYRDKISSFKRKYTRAIATGFISFLFSFPILIYYFQSASVMSILATPLISPLVQFIILITGFYFLFPFFIDIFLPLNIFLNYFISFLNFFIDKFSSLPIPILNFPIVSLFIIILYYLILLFFQYINKAYRVLLLLFFTLILIVPHLIPKDYIEVDFINVGQGDSILLITNKPRKVILVDGGKTDMGEREVIPYLKRKGIFKIDYVVCTHGDTDHKGGLDYILENFNCDKVLVPPLRLDVEDDFSDWVSKYDNRLVEVSSGDSIVIGDLKFNFLAPSDKFVVSDSNDSSLVIEVLFGESSLLLTGDCNLDVLEGLVEEKRCYDIIKASHHGSSKSYRDNLYVDLNCKSVIFSVGYNNYGHPSEVIIEDLVEEEIGYYRTDRDKDIVIKMYENKIVIN